MDCPRCLEWIASQPVGWRFWQDEPALQEELAAEHRRHNAE